MAILPPTSVAPVWNILQLLCRLWPPKLDLEQIATSRGEASSCLVRLRMVLSLSHKRAPRV